MSAKSGFQFAFQILPTIIFFSAVMAVLYYLGIMQIVIKFMAKFVKRAWERAGPRPCLYRRTSSLAEWGAPDDSAVSTQYDTL